MRRILLPVSVAFLLAAAIGFTYEQIGRWQDQRHLFRIGRAVDIGGRTLNIIVGHSMGGSYARIYAARFPSEVAGVVLVDSNHPDQHEPPLLLSPVNRMPIFARRVACYAEPFAARFGILRFVMRNGRVDVPPQFSSQESGATRALRGQLVKAFESDIEQGCAATQDGAIRPDGGSGNPEMDQAAREARSLGHVPLIVLTAGQYWKPENPVAAREVAQFHEVWVHQLQADLARLSTAGKQVIVENSDHGIPDEAPGAVVSAIKEVVNEVRAQRKE